MSFDLWKTEFILGMNAGSILTATQSLWNMHMSLSIDRAPSSDTLLADVIPTKKDDFKGFKVCMMPLVQTRPLSVPKN